MAGETVLIVDDNLANLKLVRILLAAEGYDVRTATDAQEAMDVIRGARPRLILMDIQLPGMDGLAATALLKQERATAAIPIIALTAMAMKADREKSLLAGCEAYIAKPLRYQELYATIDALLLRSKELAAGMDNPFGPAP